MAVLEVSLVCRKAVLEVLLVCTSGCVRFVVSVYQWLFLSFNLCVSVVLDLLLVCTSRCAGVHVFE